MTDREALLKCREAVAYDLGSRKRWLKRDGDYCAKKTRAVEAKIRELRELLDYIDEVSKA